MKWIQRMQHIKLNVSGYANAAQNTVSIMHGAWAMKLASQGPLGTNRCLRVATAMQLNDVTLRYRYSSTRLVCKPPFLRKKFHERKSVGQLYLDNIRSINMKKRAYGHIYRDDRFSGLYPRYLNCN
jgi:hypothetical protein